MVIKAVIPNMTLFTVYVVYFPCRREGLSILASAISFYLAFELNNLSEFLLIGVSLVLINEITITTVLFLECLLRLSSSLAVLVLIESFKQKACLEVRSFSFRHSITPTEPDAKKNNNNKKQTQLKKSKFQRVF